MNDLTGLKKQVKECIENAYCKGYKDCQATVNEQLDDARQKGYKKGIADGNINDGTFAEKVQESYDNGLKDAWECAKKIVLDPNKEGLSIEVLVDIFDKGCYTMTDIVGKYTVQEVVTKITEYEKKQDDWRAVAADDMTEEQLIRAVKALRKEIEE